MTNPFEGSRDSPLFTAARFELSHEAVGEHWEKALEVMLEMLSAYMESDAIGARRMRESQAVSVGFVDGDLHLVWSRDEA